MKKHLSTIALILVLLAGVSLLLYPTVSNYWNSRHASRAVADYAQSVQTLDRDVYDELLAEAEEYNRSLLTRENDFFLTDTQQAQYESLLDISGTGVMGGSAARRSDSTRHRGGGENEDAEWIEDHGYDPEDFDL